MLQLLISCRSVQDQQLVFYLISGAQGTFTATMVAACAEQPKKVRT